MLPDDVAIEQGHRPAAHLQEFDSQDIRNSGFSCSGKPGEEECKSLTVPGRVAALQLACHFWKCKPYGDFPPLCKAAPQFGSRKVEGTRPRRDFILGNISILIFEVDHHVKRDHVDAEFVLMGPE